MAVIDHTSNQFSFIAVSGAGPRHGGGREKELAQSAARSHAARIVHAKRRGVNRPYKRRSSDRQGSGGDNQDLVLPEPTQILKYMGLSRLDPFVRFPVELSLEDRSLVHDCMRFLSRWFQGID
jgi:hypothetical protein